MNTAFSAWVNLNFYWGNDGCSYHFNGKESDVDWTGNSGDSYDFGARMYDSRLGRWYQRDPLGFLYPYYSPYSAFANSPLVFIDPSGAELILTTPNGAEDQKAYLLQKYKNVISESFDGKVQVQVDEQTGQVLGYQVVPGKEDGMTPYDYAAMDQMNQVASSTDKTTLVLYDNTIQGSEEIDFDQYETGAIDLDDVINAGSLDDNKRTRKGILVHVMVEQQRRQQQIADGEDPEDATKKSRNHFEALKAENKCQHYKLTWDGLLPYALMGKTEQNYVTLEDKTTWTQLETVKDPDTGEVTHYEYIEIVEPPNGKAQKIYMDSQTEPRQ